MGKLIVLFGPSSGGKTTVANLLDIEKVPTVTTRKKRIGEVNGVDYHFKTKKDFEKMLKNGELAEHAEYLENYYGCLKSSLLETFNGEEVKVIVLDIEGVLYLKNNHPNDDIKYLYIGAYIDSIERRLKQRKLSDEELKNRLYKAEYHELSNKYRQHADEIIWNNDGMDINKVVNHVKKLITMLNR